MNRFFRWMKKNPYQISRDDVRGFLSWIQESYENPSVYGSMLRALKIYFRDYLGREEVVSSFRFPSISFTVKRLPSKEELQRFYRSLKTLKEKSLFLMYATTGLRRREALSLTFDEINLEERMVTARCHSGRTKSSWVTFFNIECRQVLREYLQSRKDSNKKLFPWDTRKLAKIWITAKEYTGLDITPQILRDWFCQQMGELGVPDRFIDAFYGRVPKSVLARHYTDYSPERLKRIYDRANLRVLS